MALFGTAQSLSEAFGMSLSVLRFAGLYPYWYNQTENRLYISWKFFLVTLLHLLIYTYANLTLMLNDWTDYAQPQIGPSIMTAAGNFILRILGVLITYLILGPLLVGIKRIGSTLNDYLVITNQYSTIGIDVITIYRRLQIMGPVMSLVMTGILFFNFWHMIFFYQKITHQQPSFEYFVVVVLSEFYKTMFLFFLWMKLLTIYLLSQQLNKYLMGLVQEQKQRFERELLANMGLARDAWVSAGETKY